MSTMRVDTILSSGGANTVQINGIVPAIATQAEAQAATDNTKLMTPLQVANATFSRLLTSSTITDLTASRATATNYQNTTSSWRLVFVTFTNNGTTLRMGATSGTQSTIVSANATNTTLVGIIPPGWFYSTTGTAVSSWWES